MDMPSRLTLRVSVERWPIAGSFAISRGSKTEAVVVVAELGVGKARGRGECVPYARYGENVEGVAAAIEALRPRIEAGLDRAGLQEAMPPGAARNALDCAFWDLEAKLAGRRAYDLAGLPAPRPVTTAYTLSIGSPDDMARAAAAAADRPLLTVKLGRDGDPARIAAVRRAAPKAALIVAGAFASVVRWGAMAFDPPLALLIPLQVLHALTYGAAHLGAILFITRAVPAKGMGSAQAFYSTIAAGLAMGIVGLISGALYARVGGEVYFVPALVAIIGCAAGVALLRGWNGRQLWADAEDAGVLSPTAPAKAS
jgi:hypothetical protein